MLGAEKMTPAAYSEQPLKPEEKELLKEVYSRLEVFEQENREYHEDAKEIRDILRLRDPHQDPPGVKEKTLQLQTLKAAFNNCVADQMENIPEAKLLPETPDKQNLSDDLQDAVHYILYDLNDYENLHKRRVEDFYGPGTSIMQVAWDESLSNGKGDVAVIRWPIENFIWDPKAENIQDARALIKVSWHPLSWYTQHYPEAAPYVHEEDGSWNDVGRPATQENLRTGTDEPTAMLLEYWYRTYDAKKRRYTISTAYCAGGALLEHAENVYMHGMYPFIVDTHSTIEGQPVGDGMVQELVPMMRYINRYARYIDTNLRMSSKGRLLTRRNAGIDADALSDWSKDIIEGDSIEQGQDWGWLQHAPFNGMISQQMAQLQSDLKQDSGANQFTHGETTSGVTAGKAIAALQQAGGKITNLRTLTLNMGFKKMVEQVLWLMAEFYDEDRMLLITGRDGSQRQINVNPKLFFNYERGKGAVLPPPYMVNVEVNRRNPLRVEAQNEMFMNAYTMAAQAKQYFPLSALFRMLNLDGKDKLLPVIEENENYQAQMEQMQSQMEQMQAQMEQMTKENQNLRTVSNQMTNALASMGAKGAGATGPKRQPSGAPQKVGGTGNPNTASAQAAIGRQMLTQQGQQGQAPQQGVKPF